MDDMVENGAKANMDENLDYQQFGAGAGAEAEAAAGAEATPNYSDNASSLPFACPIELIDPGLLTSGEALSSSPGELQSWPSYTPPDSQSASSTPLFENFGDVSLHENMPSIYKETYGYQQMPLHPQSYPGTPQHEEPLMLHPAYSEPSTPTSTSSWPDESTAEADMPLPLLKPQPESSDMNISRSFTGHGGNDNRDDKFIAQQPMQIALFKPHVHPYGPMLNLCKAHQASASSSLLASLNPGRYHASEHVPKIDQSFMGPHHTTKSGKRPPLFRPSGHIQRTNGNGIRADSPHRVLPYMDAGRREIGVWRSQPYPPLESRPGSRASARSQQQRRQKKAPTSAPDATVNVPAVLPMEKGGSEVSAREYALRYDRYASLEGKIII